MKKELGIYLHIPFCERKCGYCDFLSAPAPRAEIAAYAERMKGKLRSFKELAQEYEATSIFVGGGTPSLLLSQEFEALLLCVYEVFTVVPGAEITVEINPNSVNEEKLAAYKRAGVNRLSFGLQSADNQELRLLGRIHTYEDFAAAYALARKIGFGNINVDLMRGIPGQTAASCRDSLCRIIALEPEHISAYSLILEEGTPFYERYKGGEGLPSEEEEWEMYRLTGELLEKAGYLRYEISNYARKGFACRHNLGCWERKDYLGIGTGASSLIGGRRFREGEAPVSLSQTEQMEEFMFLGLRKTAGISERRFQEEFGKSAEKVYGGAIKKLMENGLLERYKRRDGGYLRLTERGLDVSNYCLGEFLLGL